MSLRSKPTRHGVDLPLDTSLLKPGMRLAVALSGGADSVALLRSLTERSGELGLVLCTVHLHHGLRGAEADADLEFCRDLALRLGLPFHESHVDTAVESRANLTTGKAGESIEEAARRLRYSWFRQLLSQELLHAVATAHNFDDQAETVLAKFLRGAWTEGLAGIAPKLESPEGLIIRPLLSATRAQIEAYLNALGQSWREDSSNRNLTFTRNRIRHELLPRLETSNPQLRSHLVQMSTLARDEEAWWQSEVAKLAPQLLLAGRPVRGGGRASGEELALDCTRLAALPPAIQRRLLRHAARQLGAEPDFGATEALRLLAINGRGGQKLGLAQGLRAERTPRELRLAVGPAAMAGTEAKKGCLEYTGLIPGEILAPGFGLHLRIDRAVPASGELARVQATLRNWKPGDRVRLRHTGAPRKVKEVLERLRITGSARQVWPVLALENRIVWMKGVELEPEPEIVIVAEPLIIDGARVPETIPKGNAHPPKESSSSGPV